jgi:hypothetical protein
VKNIIADLLMVIVVVAVGGVFAAAMFFGGKETGYTEGYCAALNGTVLNSSSCNVDGKVVEVK